MVAVTYDVGRVAAAKGGEAKAGAHRNGLFGRFMDALIESRMQQARREIARHAHLMPHVIDKHGNVFLKDLPFRGV